MYTPPLHKGSFARQRPSENFVQAQMQLFKPLNVSVSEQRSQTSKTSLSEPQASSDVFSETTAVNRKQAAAQNSCIKPKLWKQRFARQRPSGNSSSERRCISSSLRLFPEKSRNERRVKILAV